MCPCCLILIGSISKNMMDNKPSILSLFSPPSPFLDLLGFFFLFQFPKESKAFLWLSCKIMSKAECLEDQI